MRAYLKTPGWYLENTSFAPRFCSDFAPDQLSDSGRETRELPEWSTKHPLRSGFPGNFRKLKVLGTLWFPSGLPTLIYRPSGRHMHDRLGRRAKVKRESDQGEPGRWERRGAKRGFVVCAWCTSVVFTIAPSRGGVLQLRLLPAQWGFWPTQ